MIPGWMINHKLDWSILSANHGAIILLKNHQDKIVWESLAKNMNAGPILEANLHRCEMYSALFQNPCHLNLIKKVLDKHLEKLCWYDKKTVEAVACQILWSNNEELLNFIKNYVDAHPHNPLSRGYDKSDGFSNHCFAYDLTECLRRLKPSQKNNASTPAFRPLTEIDKNDWDTLSEHPHAFEILQRNQDKINWKNFSANPGIDAYIEKITKEQRIMNSLREVVHVSGEVNNITYEIIELYQKISELQTKRRQLITKY